MKTNTVDKSREIIEFVWANPSLSSSEIHEQMKFEVELLTTKRNLAKLVENKLLSTTGNGKGTKYIISPAYQLFIPIDMENYFEKDIDERNITERFNWALLRDILPQVNLFSTAELEELNSLQKKYLKNILHLPDSIYKQELERLSIDLSWKSSQIEGNTYSLLETELLFKEQIEATGKKKEEATMLLNHKIALDYIIEEPNYIDPLTISKIEEIHNLLIKGLGVSTGLRTRLVGITGTNYKPLDNKFQIQEAMTSVCELVNTRTCVFEKAFLLLLLISYIQPFVDGNKRTARIMSNAIFIKHGYCPLSFRTVNSIEYKKAMLLFYEQNNIEAFKEVFISQYEFAVRTYFQ